MDVKNISIMAQAKTKPLPASRPSRHKWLILTGFEVALSEEGSWH
jgi:hypothetical protein